jgi:hypothetical protein
LNRNEIIGTFTGKTLGYAVQGVAYYKIAEALNPQSVILIRTGTKYGIKILNYTAKKYVRTDFKSETIFSDAIDASFFAD